MPRLTLTHLHKQLILLMTVALLPTAVLAFAGLLVLVEQQRNEIRRSSLDTVRAMATAVDNELRLSIAALEALAATLRQDESNLRHFRKSAADVLMLRRTWETIVLADQTGLQIINTREPQGTTQYPLQDRDSFERTLSMRRPMVGTLVRNTTGEMMFPVRVPVIIDGEVKYVLSAGIRQEAMRQVLEQQKLPQDSVASILDSSGLVVVRSRNQAQYVGKPVSPSLLQMMAKLGREGYGETTALDGGQLYSAFGHSDVSGWGIALGTPTEAIDAGVRQSYWLLGAGMLLSLLVGGMAAVAVARRVLRPLRLLRSAALADDHGASTLPHDTLPEVKDVSEALRTAAWSRSQVDAEREEQLQRERIARTSAEDSNRSKDEFLAMLGHELRNPLAAISAAGQVLAARGLHHERDDTALRAHGILERQTRHLARLVDDLLDITRVVAGKIELDRRPMDLAGAVHQAAATLRSAGQFARHAVRVDVKHAWVSADPNRLEQIINNLVVNAVKYTPAGGSIDITVDAEGSEAVLRVSDTGMGIDESLQPRIFDLFVQGRQALHRAQGGLGVGLTLVHRLVSMHSGSVTADSRGPGQGSVFTVRLPLAEMPAMPAMSGPRVPVAGNFRVLLVEDNEDARGMMRLILENGGHTVREAADGSEGISAAGTSAFDIAFVDIGLPTLDGYEVARRIREAERRQSRAHMRLVALTGYGQPADRAHALEAGFDLHLVKPVDPELLQEVLAGLKVSQERTSEHV